jgi:hypothetical protein
MRTIQIPQLLLVLLLVFLTIPAASGAQGNSEAAASCQKVGYATVHGVKRSGDAVVEVTFRNTGDCVSYVARGGALFPNGGELGAARFHCEYAQTGATDLYNLDLSYCDLSRVWADVRYVTVDFRGSNLTGANLSNVWMLSSSFDGANLTDANLSETYLVAPYFYDADLTRTNLTYAQIQVGHFDLANLTGADFTGATVSYLSFFQTTCPDGTDSRTHLDAGGNETCVGYGVPPGLGD